MKSSKLRTVHVIAIGVFACLAVIAGMYFLVIKKQYEDIAKLQAKYTTAQTTWNRMPQVQAQYNETLDENNRISVNYTKYLNTYMPAISFQDRANGMIGLWREQSETLGPLIQNWPNKTGVTMTSSISVPAAPLNPNAIDTTLIKVPIGTISVVGDFRSILSHLKAWKNFKRLVQIEPVTLQGQSPLLTAQYTLTVLIFPRGETGPNITMSGSGGAR